MRKLMFLASAVIGMVAITSCGSVDTKIRPYTEIKENVFGIQGIVTRSDRSGIYLSLKNNTDKDMEILWSESKLNDDKISIGNYTNKGDFSSDLENEIIKPKEISHNLLHRESDIYYLDPALYQPGGIKIKALKYPAKLELVVKKGDEKEKLVMDIFKYEALDEKTENIRLEEDYIKEFKENETEEKIKEIEKDTQELRKKVRKRWHGN